MWRVHLLSLQQLRERSFLQDSARFYSFRRETDPAGDTVSWKSIAAGSHRNVGDLLFKGGKYHILSIWITGVYSGGSSDTASCLETKQPA